MPASMLRISWPLAILLVAVLLIIGRKPRLFVPLLIVFAVWMLWQMTASRRRKR
jgi:hypothetical protein